jgi:hypothetical protein
MTIGSPSRARRLLASAGALLITSLCPTPALAEMPEVDDAASERSTQARSRRERDREEQWYGDVLLVSYAAPLAVTWGALGAYALSDYEAHGALGPALVSVPAAYVAPWIVHGVHGNGGRGAISFAGSVGIGVFAVLMFAGLGGTEVRGRFIGSPAFIYSIGPALWGAMDVGDLYLNRPEPKKREGRWLALTPRVTQGRTRAELVFSGAF